MFIYVSKKCPNSTTVSNGSLSQDNRNDFIGLFEILLKSPQIYFIIFDLR
jgi:hypothetical protein